jgi:hypothetical protein
MPGTPPFDSQSPPPAINRGTGLIPDPSRVYETGITEQLYPNPFFGQIQYEADRVPLKRLEAHVAEWETQEPDIRKAAVEQGKHALAHQEAALATNERDLAHWTQRLEFFRGQGLVPPDLVVSSHRSAELTCEDHRTAIASIKADLKYQAKPHPETDPAEVKAARQIIAAAKQGTK